MKMKGEVNPKQSTKSDTPHQHELNKLLNGDSTLTAGVMRQATDILLEQPHIGSTKKDTLEQALHNAIRRNLENELGHKDGSMKELSFHQTVLQFASELANHGGYSLAFARGILQVAFPAMDPHFLSEKTLERFENDKHIQGFLDEYRNDSPFIQQHRLDEGPRFTEDWVYEFKKLVWTGADDTVARACARAVSDLFGVKQHSLSFSNALSFLKEILELHPKTIAYWVNDWDKNKAQKRVEQLKANAISLLNTLSTSKDTNYLFNLIVRHFDYETPARLFLEGFENDPTDHFVHPQMLTNTQYGLVAERGGVPVMILAPEEETDSIRQLIHQRNALTDAYKEVRHNKIQTVHFWAPQGEPFVMDYMPQKVAEKWRAETPEEQEMNALEDSVRRRFFEGLNKSDAPYPLPKSAQPRKDRIVPLQAHLFGKNKTVSANLPMLFSDTVGASIQKELGIQLRTLGLRERAYFLAFAEKLQVSDTARIKSFVESFGINGLRTFLANAYDSDASENILTLATVTDPDTVRGMFGNYSRMIDGFSALVDRVNEDADTDNDMKLFSQQVYEAVVRRAGHFFRAGKMMALWEYDTMTGFKGETMEDLSNVLKGIGLFADVLGFNKKYTQTFEKRENETLIFKIAAEGGETYQLKVFVRPKHNENGEARINVELVIPPGDELYDTFAGEECYAKKDKAGTEAVICKTRSSIRLGFDLDTKKQPPELSFDWGRDAWSGGEKLKSRTGDKMGRILGMVAPEGHHLFEGFDKRFSDPAVFANISQQLQKQLESVSVTS